MTNTAIQAQGLQIVPIAERVYLALQALDLETDGAAETHLNTIAPNATVCPVCRVDDFVHVQGCRLSPRTGGEGRK